MTLRNYVRPWIAGALTWLVVVLLSKLTYRALLGGGDLGPLLLMGFATIVALPVLSAAVAVLLLPAPTVRRPAAWLLAGVPVTVAALAVSALTVDAPTAPGVGALAVVVALAAGASLGVGWWRVRLAGTPRRSARAARTGYEAR
ncbi:hypothetical protein [Georgenia ruanii]|uniref:hypothetical protein n=1 Tax=Georgenia ruanii TaxID=348442 RepID=UPI00126414BB|nr:hypothetical protein [Georgenia ruanii]